MFSSCCSHGLSVVFVTAHLAQPESPVQNLSRNVTLKTTFIPMHFPSSPNSLRLPRLARTEVVRLPLLGKVLVEQCSTHHHPNNGTDQTTVSGHTDPHIAPDETMEHQRRCRRRWPGRLSSAASIRAPRPLSPRFVVSRKKKAALCAARCVSRQLACMHPSRFTLPREAAGRVQTHENCRSAPDLCVLN